MKVEEGLEEKRVWRIGVSVEFWLIADSAFRNIPESFILDHENLSIAKFSEQDLDEWLEEVGAVPIRSVCPYCEYTGQLRYCECPKCKAVLY